HILFGFLFWGACLPAPHSWFWVGHLVSVIPFGFFVGQMAFLTHPHTVPNPVGLMLAWPDKDNVLSFFLFLQTTLLVPVYFERVFCFWSACFPFSDDLSLL
ncbi:hypothetical protein J3E72DRAFT_336731, partial [Bipolaris maydis]|uniref:uncharacterized protein n=1 Tax=Cochliobolus heterostrophus TaxID=5016 RepID=UPI0024D72465